MSLADLRIESHDGVIVVHLTGEIDLSNASELRTTVLESIPNDALGCVLDFTSLVYIDSAGIHLLYRLGDNLRTRGQTLRVVIPPGSAAGDALRLAGVKRHVDIVAELDEGVRAVAMTAPDPG